MHALEVVVRFETTVLETVELRAGASYRIGTAPGNDLAIEGSESFAAVEGDLVRVPPGATATVFESGTAAPLVGEQRLAPAMRAELRIGRVAIAIRWVAPSDPVPRAPIDRRPYVYAAASFTAQLVLLVLALWLAPFSPPPPPPAPAPRAVHVARFPESPPVTNREPSPVPAAATAPDDPSLAPPPAEPAPDSTRSRRGRAIARAREAGVLGSDGLSDLRALAPGDLGKGFKGVRPAYREEDANARRFGGGEGWDPGGVIPTGRFATRSSAGADYELPGATPGAKTVLEMCTGRPCETTGPLARDAVVALVQAHAEALLECHDRIAGRHVRGVITLDFDIDRDGSVLRPVADGMGELSACVSRVVQKIEFPIAPGDAQTEVKLSLEFHEANPE